MFSGPVELTGALLRLLGPEGTVWTLEVTHAESDARTLVGIPPDLEPGGYRVEWRVVSADGHAVGGDFTFVVRGDGMAELLPAPPPTQPPAGEGATDPGTASPAPRAVLIATRSARNLALLTATGVLLLTAFGAAVPTAATLRARSTLALTAPLAVSVHAWLWASGALAGSSARADAFTALTATTTGRSLGVEAMLAWMVPWALLLARRPRVAAYFAVLAVVSGGFGGHPASYTPALSVPMNIVHQLAAATWLGGLLIVLTERTAADFDATARRVSAAALVSVVLVAGSGLLQSWLFLESPALLISSTFGLLLLVKAGGLLGLIGFGAFHRFRLLPNVVSPDGSRRLARSVRFELALAAAVVAVAAILSHTSPTS